MHPAFGEHLVVLATNEKVLAFGLVHAHHLFGVALGTIPPFFAANDVVGRVTENSLTAVTITDIDRRGILEALISTDQAGITTAGVASVVILVRSILLVASAYLLQFDVQSFKQLSCAVINKVHFWIELLGILENETNISDKVTWL